MITQKRGLDQVVEMSKVKVTVKWGKEVFPDVEVDLNENPLVFKSQLFALTAVPPDRMKVMIKGALLKDDDWGKAAPKDGATIMVMGSADAKPVEPPKDLPKFVEDLPESQQNTLATRAYGSGLQNLGNTCYMNSVVQCMYAVEPLRDALAGFNPAAPDPTSKLCKAARDLVKDLSNGGEPFPPYEFLMVLREKFPQFAQTGQGGVPSQQDAEECWTNLMYALHEKVKAEEGRSAIEKLFGIKTLLKLKCEESGEEQEETQSGYMLKCNIDSTVNHLHDGILLGLKDDREKQSAALGRSALFKGCSTITHLPPYLTVQLVRFFYKVDTASKAKVLRKVSFQLELDCYDYCSPELKKALEGPRAAYKEVQDRAIEAAKKAKNDAKKGPAAAGAAAEPAATAQPAAAAGGDVEMKDADGAAAAGTSTSGSQSYVGAATGKYELFGVLTHKGRSADSGHYVSWVKQKDGKWVLFDDDELHIKSDEDILALSGGGDWHMAYLLLYRAVTVPASPAPAAPSS
uniref:Ubiquitin carboxyl-terminal hydrolase n=1 Tax=Chlamydomonas leiostraca TaxID=1034604 RepID=A0A7S0WQE3_9CHLO|mmetsp:Transcript_22655/g.57687  ORF Transcript_22655/g.57687 Transcript_22655/m.57687 type:complete len:517 (+) Transcript_22655:22-1572(+)